MNLYGRIIPDEGLARTILKYIGTHYDDLYPSWGKIPTKVRGQMFNEFKKHYVWTPQHEEKIQANFNYKAGCLQEYFVNVGGTIEFQHLWCQISGPSYRNFGIVMKSLKRGVTLGKWLAHRRKVVLYTPVELLVSLLERREWRKNWVGRYLKRSYSRSLTQRRRQTPRKEKKGLRHVLKRHMRDLCKKFRSIVVPYLWKVKMHHCHKKLQSSCGERVLVNRLER